MINARAETVATKPAFRVAFRKRRCLILAPGNYILWLGPGVQEPDRLQALLPDPTPLKR